MNNLLVLLFGGFSVQPSLRFNIVANLYEI